MHNDEQSVAKLREQQSRRAKGTVITLSAKWFANKHYLTSYQSVRTETDDMQFVKVALRSRLGIIAISCL